MGTITDVLDAAETARKRGSLYLCAQLLELAEVLLEAVDHLSTAVSRLALIELASRHPIASATEAEIMRHYYLEGSSR